MSGMGRLACPSLFGATSHVQFLVRGPWCLHPSIPHTPAASTPFPIEWCSGPSFCASVCFENPVGLSFENPVGLNHWSFELKLDLG